MNSLETEGSSDESSGNTVKVRILYFSFQVFLATPLHFRFVDLILVHTYIVKDNILDFNCGFHLCYVQANQTGRKRSRKETPTTVAAGITLFFTKSKILMNIRVGQVFSSVGYLSLYTWHVPVYLFFFSLLF